MLSRSARTTRVNRRGVGYNNNTRSTGGVIRRTPTTRVGPYVPASSHPANVVLSVPSDGQVPVRDTDLATTEQQDVPVVPPADEEVELDLNVVTPPSEDDQASAFPSTGKNGPRVRNFVFTLNNYTDEEYNWFLTRHGNPTWLIVGKEICPTTGTPHLQGINLTTLLANSLGAMCLGTTVAFKTLKKWLPFQRAHIEPMRGSPHDSKVYCTKVDANAFEFGTCPAKGTKLLDIAVNAIRSGSSLRQLANKDDESARAVVVHGRGLSTLSNLTTSSRDPAKPPAVYWLHGSTGTGKTRCAFELGLRYAGGCSDDLCIIASPTLQWFEPYDRQKVVIFDDFRAKGVSFNFLLRVLDRYPLLVPLKGGYANWNPEVVFLTTPRAPSETFEVRSQHKPEDVQQLIRRLKRVVNFDEPEDVEEFKDFFNSTIPEPPVQASEASDISGGADNSIGGRTDPNGSDSAARAARRADMVESARIIRALCEEDSSDSGVGESVDDSCGQSQGDGGIQQVSQVDSDLELLGTPEDEVFESEETI